MKLGAHGPNRLTSGPRAQIMRKSIFTAESQFSWNWVLTPRIYAKTVPELRSWENQFLRPNRNFHEIGCSRPKSTHKRSPSSDHEKINFYGRIAIFMKLRPNRCSRPKSTHKRSPSSDHEKINFYGRIAIFMKLGAHGPNRLTSGPRAQIMRKSIFTPSNFHEIGCSWPKSTHKRSPSSDHENQSIFGCSRPNQAAISWNWVLTAQIDSKGSPSSIMRKSIFTAKSQFSWNWLLTAQVDSQAVPELRSWEYQFLRPNRKFHEIGCSRPKSTHKRSPSSDHEKINFYGRIAIFMKLGHGPNRLRKGSPSSDHEKINFYGQIAIFMKLELTDQSTQSGPRSDHENINFYGRIANFMKLGAHGGPQIMRKSIFTNRNKVLTVPELRSWENQFLRPNRNFHEIGCSRPKSTHKRSPSSDHEKINFYGQIAIFMKLGAHGPNRLTSGPRAQIMRKSIFTAESQFSWNWVITAQIDSQSGPRAQIMRKSIFTAESQFSWNWVLTAQIDAQVVPELKTSEYQFLRSNRNFHEIGCSRPKSTHKSSPSSEHQNINF